MKRNTLFFAVLIIFITVNVYSQKQNKKTTITITNVWAYPAVRHANTAMYLTIQNNSNKADTLVKVESSAADIVQVHETFKRDNDQTGMRHVDFVAVPPKSTIELKPGGFHVMMIDMQVDFRIRSTMNAVLTFKHAGEIKVAAIVKPTTYTKN